MLKIFFYILITLTSVQALLPSYPAIISVPVADLVPDALSARHAHGKTVRQRYHSLPEHGGDSKSHIGCPRLHQALFQEHVIVHDTVKDEVWIELLNCFFQTPHNQEKNTRYWTLSSNIIPCKKLAAKGVDLSALPLPVRFDDHRSVEAENIITLIEPWYYPGTKKWYSAGTRFVLKEIIDDTYVVTMLNPKHMRIDEAFIPKKNALFLPKLTNEQKIAVMVKLLQHWAHQENGFIPYVWGGTSFTYLCNEPFVQKKMKLCDDIHHICYVREDAPFSPRSGFDCSGMIARAAQICGIPYFFKNTTAITKQLKPLTNEPLENGDLIWFNGHVIVVSDVEKNLMVEARGYSSGYGKVQEISVKQMFKDMNTYADIIKAYKNKQKLERLNSAGQVADSVKITLFKLNSVWK